MFKSLFVYSMIIVAAAPALADSGGFLIDDDGAPASEVETKPAPAKPTSMAPQAVKSALPACPTMSNDSCAISAAVESLTGINQPFSKTMGSSKGDTFSLVTSGSLNCGGGKKSPPAYVKLTGSYNITVDVKLCSAGGQLRGTIYGGSYSLTIAPASAGRSIRLTNSADGSTSIFSVR